MRNNYLLLLLVYVFSFNMYAQAPGCANVKGGDVNGNPVAPICNPGECRQIKATYLETGGTNTYTVSSIPYAPPFPFVGGNSIPITQDDDWSPIINLGFKFCFFNQAYDKVLICDNGALSFSIAGPGGIPGGLYTPTSGSGYAFNTGIPQNTQTVPYRNAIFGVLQDLNPVVSPANHSINYQIIGQAPCRTLVFNIYEMGHYSCGVSQGTQTSQMVLYETTNVVEVYVKRRTSCTTFNNGSGLIGIQNQAGTVGYTPPGRNTGTWSVLTPEAWRFTPSGPSNVTFQWLDASGTPISTSTTMTVCPTQTTVYTAEATYTACDGTKTVVRDNVVVPVSTFDINEPNDLNKCPQDNTCWDLSPNTPVVLGTLNPADYFVTYYPTLTDAETESNWINDPTCYNPVAGNDFVFVRVNDPNSDCYKIKSFELIRGGSSAPDFTPVGPLCLNTTPPTLPTTSNNGFNGTWSPATVSTSAVGTTTYTFTPNPGECASPTTMDIQIIAEPTASITGSTICENTSGTLTVTGTPNASVDYTVGGGTPVTITLDATGTATITTPNLSTTTTYTLVSVTSAGTTPCTKTLNTSADVTVRQLPTATISGSTTVCLNGTAVISFTGTPNATIHYDVDGSAGTVTLDASGNGSVTTPPLTANSTYTLIDVVTNYPTAPQCTNTATGSATVTIASQPTATISGSTTICSGDTAVLTFNGTANTVVTYNNGTANATVTLDGTGNGTVTVGPLTATTTYNLVSISTQGASPCTAPLTGSATITVNALPTATISASTLICSGTTAVVSFTGPANGVVTYSDGTTTTTITLDASGNASITTPVLTAPATYSLVSVSTDPAVTPVCSQNQSASVTIGVKDLPVVTVTGPASVCEGSTANIVFNGTPNATVTYTIGTDPTPFTVSLNSGGTATVTTAALTAPVTYYLVSAVSNGTPACSQPQTGSHTVNTVVAPTISNPSQLEVCDANNDGFETFDLSVKIAEITGGNTALTVTFHETPQDAQLGNYPIAMPLYTNINPWTQTLYIRVVNTGVNACASYSTLTLVVNRRPEIVPNVTNYELCETSTPGDGFEVFNLTTKDAEVTGTQTGITVTYYTTQADAQSGNSPIGTPASYTNATNPQTIWYQLENASGCIAVGSFQLIVNPLPVVPSPVPAYSLCDYTGASLYEQFDLSTKIPEIIGTTTGLEVKFYKTQAEANAGVDGTELPLLYTNEVATVQTIFVRVTNSTTRCYSVTAMDLRVEPLPVLVMPTTPVTTCDENNDGFGEFDLTTLTTDMLNGEANVVISFHETQQNAQNGLFPITVQPYQNINPWNQTLWVLATNTVTGCKSVYSFQLRVEPAPIMPTLLDLDECDTDSNPHDNQTSFDLTVHTATILAAQTGAATDYEVKYFISEANAENGSPFIVSDGNFIGTNGQTIWVRVTHIATGCYTIGDFNLIVNSPLLLTQPDEITLCDDALPNDQRQIFDLTIRESQITGGATGYTFKYYSTTALPPNPADEITTPTAYQNIATVQTILVEVISGAQCSSYITLTIRVTPLPVPKFDPAPLVECDDDYPGDGITFFDVTQNAVYIQNNQPSYVLTYHASEADALAGINAIATPTNWQNMDADGNALTSVWVRVTTAPANNRDRCSLVVEQPLIVNPRPAAGPVSDYHMCQIPFTGSGVFDLSTKTPEALAGQGPAGYTVTYHASQADADTGAAPLATSHPSTVNGETIWVRVVNTTTGCYNTTSFQLFVERGSEATAVPDITRCDDLNDQTETFDLSSLDATILGPVQAADPNFSVSYYASDADLANGTPIATPATYTITDYLTHEIIAVVKNTYSAYGCPVEVRFNITVYRLPEPTPNAGFVCIDQETGTVLNTHIINSGLDATTHTFQWYEDDTSGTPQPISGATGATYEVNHPGTYSVIATSTVTGCISLPAEVVITQSEPAEINAYVSNAFTDNQTITVEAIGIGDYVYQLDEGDIQTSPIFTNVSSGTHVVTVYDLNGCETMTEEVMAINYPHFFTPNGDGYNDTWNIKALSGDATATIHIYDRYGKLLKQIKPMPEGGWDGTLNGQSLPSTDYWFTVTYTENGMLKEFKAHFSLKR